MGNGGAIYACRHRMNAEANAATKDRESEPGFSSTTVRLAFNASEAAALCSAAGVGVVSIAIRDAGSCKIECRTNAGADELRLHFADHVITEPTGRNRHGQRSETK